MKLLAADGLKMDPNQPAAGHLLQLAAGAGHAELAAWLLQQGVGVRELLEDGADNAMWAAVKGNHFGVVDVLLKEGARIDVRDSKGCTPLGWAGANERGAMVQFLVDRGASMLAWNTHGNVPRRCGGWGGAGMEHTWGPGGMCVWGDGLEHMCVCVGGGWPGTHMGVGWGWPGTHLGVGWGWGGAGLEHTCVCVGGGWPG